MDWGELALTKALVPLRFLFHEVLPLASVTPVTDCAPKLCLHRERVAKNSTCFGFFTNFSFSSHKRGTELISPEAVEYQISGHEGKVGSFSRSYVSYQKVISISPAQTRNGNGQSHRFYIKTTSAS